MRTTKKVTLRTYTGHAEFLVQEVDGISASEVLAKLGEWVGPGLVALADDTEQGRAEAARRLFSALSPEALAYLRRKLLASGCFVQHEGCKEELTEMLLGQLFRGHPGSLFALLVHAVRVNFSDFFSDFALYLGADGEALLKRVKSTALKKTGLSSEPETPASGGPPGASSSGE